MYFAIGFFAAGLVCVGAVPLVHTRAQRLIIERLKNLVPICVGEVIAEKDILRADFAMTVRRQEQRIEKLTANAAIYLATLGRNADIINKLKATREEQKLEILDLKNQVEMLKKRLAAPLTPKVSLFPGVSESRSDAA